MSIERIQINTPAPYDGLWQLFPKELQLAIGELERRLVVNRQSDINTLRSALAIDTSIVPSEQSGNSTPSEASIAQSTDVEDALVYAMNFQG